MEHYSIFYKPVNSFLNMYGVHLDDWFIMLIFITLLFAFVFIPLSKKFVVKNPSRWQLALELIVKGFIALIDEQIGKGGHKRFLPFIGTLGFFIFTANFLGLIFIFSAPTSSPFVTFGLGILSFVTYNLVGIKTHGLKYIKHFLGPILFMAPLFLIIEIFSHLSRPFSLGLRLFANIFGEHQVSGIITSLSPAIAPIPLMAIGLFAALMQTFVFVLLTTIYIAGAEAEEH